MNKLEKTHIIQRVDVGLVFYQKFSHSNGNDKLISDQWFD